MEELDLGGSIGEAHDKLNLVVGSLHNAVRLSTEAEHVRTASSSLAIIWYLGVQYLQQFFIQSLFIGSALIYSLISRIICLFRSKLFDR